MPFIGRFVRHIPDANFRMIRYYGFLANAVRGKLLPVVYELLNQSVKQKTSLDWRTIMNKTFNIDQLECILCGSELAFVGAVFGVSQSELSNHHFELANAKLITC